MLIESLVILPLAAGGAALLTRPHGPRRLLLLVAALAHLGLVLACWAGPVEPAWGGTLDLDAAGRLFLTIASVLFAAAAAYAQSYLKQEDPGLRSDFQEGLAFANAPERVFTACLLFFLAAMTLVAAARHLGLLWVGVEATTLASAPLIYFHRHRRSLEATWKYLIICSVGIALALLGNILLSYALFDPGSGIPPMDLDAVLARAAGAHPAWLKAAFACVLVGYGTKAGLAPMHSWLPDAHSESPSLVSALLSGALLNCALLGVLRLFAVCVAAGLGDFARELLVAFGLTSMGVAAAFILGQGDFKRLLAYSSVEHMGIITLGIGLGGGAAFGSMLHLAGHSLAKAMLFMLAGNILAAFHTKSAHDVHGAVRALPVTGPLWVAGFLAIVGCPPFSLFVSEYAIAAGALSSGRIGVAAAFLLLLGVVFVGMATPVLRMAQGPTPPGMAEARPEPALAVLPALALGCGVLVLGLWLPAPLAATMREAATIFGGAL